MLGEACVDAGFCHVAEFAAGNALTDDEGDVLAVLLGGRLGRVTDTVIVGGGEVFRVRVHGYSPFLRTTSAFAGLVAAIFGLLDM